MCRFMVGYKLDAKDNRTCHASGDPSRMYRVPNRFFFFFLEIFTEVAGKRLLTGYWLRTIKHIFLFEAIYLYNS